MKLAVLRIRGRMKLRPQAKKTLELLRLERPNHCVLVDDTPQNKGMLAVVKDYIAFGPVDEETIYRLLRKRGKGADIKDEELKKAAKEIFGGKKTKDFVKPVFRLRPPSKGYKDIKRAYPMGDLGKRDDMDSLIRRMV
jgi:large subunit ribosomal protein L30